MSHRVSRVIDRVKEWAHNRLVGGERHRKKSAALGRTIEGRPETSSARDAAGKHERENHLPA